jgi:predicted DNA-binding WGR domain protein
MSSSSTSWKENNDTLGIDLNDLVNAANISDVSKTSSLNVLSESTDSDAEALLDLWKTATVVSEAETAEDKRYAVPKEFPGDKLMKLKAASLVHGDANVIRFTAKAARVIKTVVLSESNAYAKGAIRKPYSVIMAEAKARTATMSTLAFQRTAELQTFAQRNSPIPPEYMPDNDTPYIESRRIVKLNPSQNENKQYVIRLFNFNGKWVVIGWNGRNERGRPLVIQPKGAFDSRNQAQAVFESVIQAKRADGYRPAESQDHPDLIGRSQPRASAPEPAATVPVAAAPVSRPATPTSKSTPKSTVNPTKPSVQETAEDVMPSDADIDAMLADLDSGEDLLG